MQSIATTGTFIRSCSSRVLFCNAGSPANPMGSCQAWRQSLRNKISSGQPKWALARLRTKSEVHRGTSLRFPPSGKKGIVLFSPAAANSGPPPETTDSELAKETFGGNCFSAKRAEFCLVHRSPQDRTEDHGNNPQKQRAQKQTLHLLQVKFGFAANTLKFSVMTLPHLNLLGLAHWRRCRVP